MKTLHFVSKQALKQKYRFDVLNRLGEMYDVDVEILSTGETGAFSKSSKHIKVNKFRSWIPIRSKFSFFPGALNYIFRRRPDVVLGVANVSQFTEFACLLLCRILNIRFVLWSHGYDHGKRPSHILERLREYILLLMHRWSDRVITFSGAGEEYLVLNGVLRSNIITANNTLDTDKLLSLKESLSTSISKNDLKIELNLSLNEKVVLFCGRLYPEKRALDAVRSMEILKHENIKLIVIGDGGEYSLIESYIKEKMLGDRVKLLGPIYDDESLAKWFTVADIFLMPGDVGLAIVHAFCFDLPLLTYNVCTHGPEIEYLEHGVNGFIVQEGEIPCLANKIKELVSDESLLFDLSAGALTTVKKKADIKIMVERMNFALFN